MIGKTQGLIARQIDMEIGIPMMDIRKIVRKIDPKKSHLNEAKYSEWTQSVYMNNWGVHC